MPMTFGWWRPAIFMPADANQWTEQRRRVVLLHELAHVLRGDVAAHLVTRVILTLYWFNPFAWIAWREFLKERERATDDLVLQAGARASDYAGHLVDVARSHATTAAGLGGRSPDGAPFATRKPGGRDSGCEDESRPAESRGHVDCRCDRDRDGRAARGGACAGFGRSRCPAISTW